VDDAVRVIDEAIQRVSSTADLGALENRLEHTIARLGVAFENTTAAFSRIRDTDMAREMTTLSRNQVLLQAGTAMLAQANNRPQGVLRLLS
jgi:flagellin